MELQHALYVSRACVADEQETMNEILAVSQRNNAAAGITGFLHREKDHFLQFLEGPKTALHTTLARIGRDSRHRQFEVLLHDAARTRFLPDWQMGVFDPNQFRLSDLLDTGANAFDVTAVDPFDLIVFLVSNAQCMRTHV